MKMPIAFDLEALRKEHGCTVYLETGLYDPRTEVSCKKALNCNFDRVYTIEIRNDWVALGKEVFAKHVQSDKLRIIQDDSTNLAKHLKNNPDFDKKKTLFFLDAHVDNDEIKFYTKRCPLFEELQAIKGLARKDHVIVVDDLRIISTPFPWCEDSYGNIDFFTAMVQMIKSINPNYTFKLLDGFIPEDVLVAYVA